MESTADPVMHSNYPTRKGWLSWIGTGACSLGITLMIFILMNALLHPAPASLTLTSPPVQVNVIRIPRPDTPVVHKTPNRRQLSLKNRNRCPKRRMKSTRFQIKSTF